MISLLVFLLIPVMMLLIIIELYLYHCFYYFSHAARCAEQPEAAEGARAGGPYFIRKPCQLLGR